jgi:hypothetical protein
MKTMIDFSQIDLPRIAKILSTVSTPTENIQYFDVGRMVEKIYEKCSNGLLIRQNSTGVDLVDLHGVTYESKKITFDNKAKRSVRNAIVMNGWGNADVSNFIPADYYIFTDPKLLRACCVPGSMLYNIKRASKGSNITASCNPQPEHFFLDGGERINRDYFEEKEIFVNNFIDSIK